MRYVTVILDPSDDHETINDLRQIRVEDEVVATYEAIYDINPLDDGTVVQLVRLIGDTERLVRTAIDSSDVSFIADSGETGFMHIHFKPGEIDQALFEIVDTHVVSVDWPVIFTDRGIQLTLIGEDTTLREVVATLSERIDIILEKTGDYHPGMSDPSWQLTDRQCDIVRAAITEGYYDHPRKTSQRDLAATLELSRGTVAEHLRKAEAKIMREVMN